MGSDPAHYLSDGDRIHGSPRKRSDTVGEVGSSCGEGGEARGAGGGTGDRPEPGGEPLEVDRGRGRHVLQVRLGQPR